MAQYKKNLKVNTIDVLRRAGKFGCEEEKSIPKVVVKLVAATNLFLRLLSNWWLQQTSIKKVLRLWSNWWLQQNLFLEVVVKLVASTDFGKKSISEVGVKLVASTNFD